MHTPLSRSANFRSSARILHRVDWRVTGRVVRELKHNGIVGWRVSEDENVVHRVRVVFVLREAHQLIEDMFHLPASTTEPQWQKNTCKTKVVFVRSATRCDPKCNLSTRAHV